MRRRWVLIPGLVGLQALALLGGLALTYLASQEVLLRHAEDLAARIARDATAYTEAFLEPARKAAILGGQLAEGGVLDVSDRSQMTRYLFEELRAEAAFEGLYYGDQAGNFTFVSRDTEAGAMARAKLVSTAPGRRVRLIWYSGGYESVASQIDAADDFDPRGRPWYRAAVAQRGVAWTPPYIYFSSQLPGITAAIAVRDPEGGAVAGVFGVDIGLAALSAFLDGLEISPRGSAAIIAETGAIIAHSDVEMRGVTEADGQVRFGTVDDHADPMLARATAAIAGGLAGLFPGEIRLARFEAEGGAWLAAVQRLRLAQTPWTVVTYLPEADILAPLWRVRDTALVVTLLVLAATAGLAGVFLRAVAR